jgi:hypothetical protein
MPPMSGLLGTLSGRLQRWSKQVSRPAAESMVSPTCRLSTVHDEVIQPPDSRHHEERQVDMKEVTAVDVFTFVSTFFSSRYVLFAEGRWELRKA